jgi:hypothetical protein
VIDNPGVGHGDPQELPGPLVVVCPPSSTALSVAVRDVAEPGFLKTT